jgi:phosphohistidine phosphatase
MKTIILIRHAKSSWKFEELKDIERPLKKRGIADASLMASIFHEMQLRPGKIISSPAVRALATAKAFASEEKIPENEIVVNQQLYLESKTKMLNIVNALDDGIQTVVLVGHNPALTDFANALTNGDIENIPTSGMVGIGFECESWKEVERGKGKQLFFEVPKPHRKKIEKAKS